VTAASVNLIGIIGFVILAVGIAAVLAFKKRPRWPGDWSK